MSGGHFNYDQYRIEYIVDEIEHIVKINGSTEKDKFGQDIGYHFKPETISKFKEAIELLRKAQIAAQRIDWLVSGDDSEESFHERWKEEMGSLEDES